MSRGYSSQSRYYCGSPLHESNISWIYSKSDYFPAEHYSRSARNDLIDIVCETLFNDRFLQTLLNLLTVCVKPSPALQALARRAATWRWLSSNTITVSVTRKNNAEIFNFPDPGSLPLAQQNTGTSAYYLKRPIRARDHHKQ